MTTVDALSCQAIRNVALTLSDTYANKNKTELVGEIMRLMKESRVKDEEIETLKKRLMLYKSIDK